MMKAQQVHGGHPTGGLPPLVNQGDITPIGTPPLLANSPDEDDEHGGMSPLPHDSQSPVSTPPGAAAPPTPASLPSHNTYVPPVSITIH